MAKEITKLANPVATVADEGGISVTLPSAICNNSEVLRWLHHWVVDAMADHGHADWIGGAVERHLENLSADIVDTTIADLVRQAIEATSKPAESRPPKKAKKRKRK